MPSGWLWDSGRRQGLDCTGEKQQAPTHLTTRRSATITHLSNPLKEVGLSMLHGKGCILSGHEVLAFGCLCCPYPAEAHGPDTDCPPWPVGPTVSAVCLETSSSQMHLWRPCSYCETLLCIWCFLWSHEHLGASMSQGSTLLSLSAARSKSRIAACTVSSKVFEAASAGRRACSACDEASSALPAGSFSTSKIDVPACDPLG